MPEGAPQIDAVLALTVNASSGDTSARPLTLEDSTMKLVVGITMGFLAASTLAWAFTVKFPKTARVRASVSVDENGQVLGGPLQSESRWRISPHGAA